MPSLEIRGATAADLDTLLALYEQLSPSNAGAGRGPAAAALEDMLAAPGVSLFVADEAGTVVGTATLVVVPNLTHHARPWAQLENMVVAESRRRSGAGRALLRHCIDAAWASGCYKVQLQSDNARAPAHAFYEQHGFAASSRGYRLYQDH